MATSAFFELGIGTSGLLASQRSLVTTGNNVTNANTEGYSRQVTTQKASKALSAAGAGMIGTGSEVVSIGRVRDSYLDTKYRLQNNKLAEYTTKYEKMNEISLQFNEPSDSGINSVINDVFTSIQNLTTNTQNSSYFESVSNSLECLLETVNNIGENLAQEQSLVNDEVSYTVDEINSIASQIQALNIQILKYEVNGNEASSLRDDRDLLVSKLSEYVNVTTEENLVEGTDVYKFTVKINGQELVCHDRVNSLEVVKRDAVLNPEDEDVTYNVIWSNGFEFDEYSSSLSGKLKSLIDIRDGNCNNQMKGTVKSISDNTTTGEKIVVLENVSRADIGEDGIIKIRGREYHFVGSDYNKEDKTLSVTLASDNEFPDDFNTTFYEGGQAKVGTDVDYRGIPYYINKLNEFMRTIAGAMNEGIYRNGYSIDGMTGTVNGYTQSGETGMYLITYEDSQLGTLGQGDDVDYEKMNIFNMSLSRELQEDSRNIAISAVQNPSESQSDLVNELSSLSHIDVFNEGEIADYMSSIISEVAMDVNQSQRYQEIQENLVLYTENKIQEVSGVDNNEEMTNLVKYQSAYKASARIINVMNEVYDTLINGIWG